jgi:hypothetical protein
MKHHTTAAFGLNGLLGYGTSDVEEDANVYATSKAIDEDEKLIFEYERLLQRSSQFQDVQEKQQMFSCYRKILKKYTLPKAIKGAAIAATGIGIATLIYKALNNKRR